jgi:SAM-dependent methyltransferase
MTDISDYLSGQRLYGDDFTASQITAWFIDEQEAYADLGAKNAEAYAYGYHALNFRHGFRFIADRRFHRLLGFGSAYGDELKPIAGAVDHITVVDPSDAFVRTEIFGTSATYVKPTSDGALPFANGIFDLATCLGVLHHMPNVSFAISEIARVIAEDGYMLLREPIVSMGDWTKPRQGLTKRERGIPIKILESIVTQYGFEIVHKSLCMFPLTPRLFKWRKPSAYDSPLAVIIDSMLSEAFAWNINYHPNNPLQRLRPTSAFLLLRKIKTIHKLG